MKTFKGYTIKAITCCVSKGMLILLAIVCTVGSIGWSIYFANHRHEAKCEALLDAHNAAVRQDQNEFGLTESHPRAEKTWKAYLDACSSRGASEDKPRPAWKVKVGKVLDVAGPALGGFWIAVLLLMQICSSNIVYCQLAVDTKRKPWYWLPKKWGGDPLPGREWTNCEKCGHGEPETDEAYRARVLG